MGLNEKIAARLEELSRLMEVTGVDTFKVIAVSRAARTIDGMTEDLGAIVEDRKALTALPGIGAKIADKIQEFARTGAIEELEELRASVPAGLLAVMEIPGLGPKTVRAMWRDAGIESVEDLRKAIDDGSISKVPRMGAKTVENIAKAIEFMESSAGRAARGEALPLAERIVGRMLKVKGVKAAEYAGSLRRGRDTIGDIDVLVSSKDSAAAGEAFRAMPEMEQVLVKGEAKSSVRARMDDGRMVQVDLRVTDPSRFGAALLYFTGSKEHNVRLRERALSQGMSLNEYGLFPEDGEKSPPQDRGVKPAAAATEEEIYAALGLPWIPPALREDQGELGFEPGHEFGLVEVSEIRAELHAHTTASDGVMSIVELAQAAKARGMHTIAVTDHSKSSAIANGLTVERLLEHIEAVRAAAKEVKGITILAGSEVDILADGTLDYPDEVLERLDVVVASPHASLGQKEKEATARLIRAASHPLVHILGHPTGRLINARPGLSPDMGKVIEAAVAAGTALEINAHWMRLDLRDSHVRQAIAAGALIAIDCDVHRPEDFDNLRHGVATAQRGGVTTKRCVNTWTAGRLHGWLREKRPGR